LGPNTFYQTSVSISAFPAGITTIPSNCFNPNAATVTSRAKITSLTFHGNITTIATTAFKTQVNLTNITVNRATPPTTAADAFDGIVLSNIDLYVPTGAAENYNTAPWQDMNIHEIEVGTLTVTHTTEENLEAEITAALDGAAATSITNLVINGSANLTYDDCQAIASAFPTADLKTLDLSNAHFENNTIPNAAANNCGAFNLTTASGLLVTSVILPSDLEVIGTRAFLRFPNLTTISLPAGLKTIRANAFYGSNNLALSELPALLTALVEYAFFQTSVSIGSFPAGITTIPSNCFNTNGSSERAKIISLTLHGEITEIASKAFAGQSNLTSVTVNRTTPPTTAIDAFDGITLSNVDLYVPTGSEAAYDVEPWQSMNIHATVTGIDVVSPNEQANVISVKYYNLQGVEIPVKTLRATSLRGGIYIVKKIYDNHTVTTEKTINIQ
jgi:biopolymer transport protein ExbD